VIRRTRPKEIFTQHGGDLNIDHSITFRATLIAARPMVGQSVRGVYAYEVPSSTEWAFMKFEPRFSPDLFVDISTTLAAKVQAMEAYESERRDFPHPRSPAALEAIARRWGSVVGVEAAEAFETIWKVE
jgi:LmbE family N-acetylglucosaminyl deacetylase